ncbi:MAG: preprotein translocase subunit SecE [Lachnospiraceae bacterium]|nr:preprotein translocase subunit SecE [Lachnospiraceae bacterium]
MSESNNKMSLSSYWKGLKGEFSKIIWPDKESVVKQTATVVIITIILSLIIVLLDAGIQNVLDKIIA